MENTYFKMVGQKVGGKVVLVAVVDEGVMNGLTLPNSFEVQSLKQAPTIYSGIYPTIKINLDTLKEREDLKGKGIAGILTTEDWYCKTQKENDIFGISLD